MQDNFYQSVAGQYKGKICHRVHLLKDDPMCKIFSAKPAPDTDITFYLAKLHYHTDTITKSWYNNLHI